MDDYFPTLKRPKKKLVFPITNPRVPCQWAEGDLENVDKMFDDLDSKVEDFPSPSPEIHITKDVKGYMERNGDKEYKPYPSVSPELAIDSETPFKRHGPVKTSSPIEENIIQHKNKQKKNEENSASPILFDCEERNPDLEMGGQASEKHKYIRKDESDDSMFETLPKTFIINKISTQKKPARSKSSKPSCPPLSPEKLEATPAAPEKPAESVQLPTRSKMTAFLQKLRDAGQPKPASTGFLQAKVQPQVTESEPEDYFLILEDDAPLYVSIPRKPAKIFKETQSKSSSFDKETKDTPVENAEDGLQAAEQDCTNPGSPTSIEKTKGEIEKVSESNSAPEKVPVVTQSKEIDNILDPGKTKKKKGKAVKSKSVGKVVDTNYVNVMKTPEAKVKTVRQKKSKPLKDIDADSLKKTPSKEARKGALADVLEEQSPAPESLIPGVNNVNASSMEGTSIGESSEVLEKRKRKPSGQWWMVSPQSPQQQPTDKQPAVKKRKERIKKVIPSSSSDDDQKPKAERKDNKQRTLKKARIVRRILPEDSESSQDKALDQVFDSSPLVFAPREPGTSSEHIFSKVYQKQNTSREKLASPTRPGEQLGSKETPHRARKSHTNQRQLTSTPEDKQGPLLQPQKSEQSEQGKTLGETKKRRKCPSMPLEGPVQQSVAPHGALYGTINVEPPLNKKKNTKRRLSKQNNNNPPAAEDAEADHNVVCMEVDEANGDHGIIQEGMSTVIRSGPPSMIGLGNYEEDEDMVRPSSLIQPALCASDLCAPPLRPLVLQPKDRVNLQEWLKCLWPSTDRGSEITPDHFEWYGYQGRAFGLTVDIQTSSICNGKMLLGSFMKKPLWVDHSARTVFNLLTSSVSLIVDSNKSCYSAGQSFMVPPGQAYSIHNLCAQPAVLYFTRVYEEESDTQDFHM